MSQHPIRLRGRPMSTPLLRSLALTFILVALATPHARAQTPSPAGAPPAPETLFHTFSIAAVDPETGESGVAVTTRVACVGNAVPWVRAGVGAVATQAWTRMAYGPELLDLLEEGVPADEALRRRLEADDDRERRQVGVIGMDGSLAQHTGSGTTAWAGHRSGTDYVAQGNLLVGPEVVDAVAETFEGSRGSGRHLADRLVEALEAGQATGGDARAGRLQSAALLVADPRDDGALRDDGISTNLNICEHPTPVAELRRQYDTVSGTLGFRPLQLPEGDDVAQLRILLHALGFYRADETELPPVNQLRRYDSTLVEAVDRYREDRGLSTPSMGTPPGWVDREMVERLWAEVEAAGLTQPVRERIGHLTRIRR
ncbi:MAG: DUF1028 domain-containing protein [Gemmatimonadales bacterium]|nr:MAG: DUF1028 domain-containing protein [Gemmatimonadales bacterium]